MSKSTKCRSKTKHGAGELGHALHANDSGSVPPASTGVGPKHDQDSPYNSWYCKPWVALYPWTLTLYLAELNKIV